MDDFLNDARCLEYHDNVRETHLKHKITKKILVSMMKKQLRFFFLIFFNIEYPLIQNFYPTKKKKKN